MQRLELQFYAFFMIMLSGIALGLLFDLLRAVRSYYRPNQILGALGDLVFWGAATVVFGSGLFLGNWGEFRFYVLVALLLGLGLYYWLASPLILALIDAVFQAITWFLDLLWMLVLKLLWAPVVALASLLLGLGRVLWGWLRSVLSALWDGLDALGSWLLQPLIGPYRCLKLHYLLWKRRVKRRLRHWLFGPPRSGHK